MSDGKLTEISVKSNSSLSQSHTRDILMYQEQT